MNCGGDTMGNNGFTIAFRAVCPVEMEWKTRNFATAEGADDALSDIYRRGDLELQSGFIIHRYKQNRRTVAFIMLNKEHDIWLCNGTPSDFGFCWTVHTVKEAETIALEYIPSINLREVV